MSSSSLDSQLTSGLCQSVAARKSDFYTECRLPNWSHDSYRFTVLVEIASSPSSSFYKSPIVSTIQFVLFERRQWRDNIIFDK